MPPLDDETDDPTPALTWRLAELRRARLGQADEALRLYAQLVERGPPLGPLADPRTGAVHPPRAAAGDRHGARAGRADRRRFVRVRWSIGRRCSPSGRAPPTRRATRWPRSILDPRNPGRAGDARTPLRRGGRLARAGRRAGSARGQAPGGAGGAAALRAGSRRRAWGGRTVAREAYRKAMTLDPNAGRAARGPERAGGRAKGTGPRSRRCSTASLRARRRRSARGRCSWSWRSSTATG